MSMSFGSALVKPSTAALGASFSATENVQCEWASNTTMVFSQVDSTVPGLVALTDRRGKRVTKELSASVTWDITSTDADNGLLTGTKANSKGYELFWIWGTGKGLKPVGLLNATAWDWALLPAGYTHKGKVSAWAATNSSGNIRPCRTEDGHMSYGMNGASAYTEIDVVTSKTTAAEIDVDCSEVVPSCRKWTLVSVLFENTSSTARNSYVSIGSNAIGGVWSIANTSGYTRGGFQQDLIPNGGNDITTAFKVSLTGTATGNGMSVYVRGAIL